MKLEKKPLCLRISLKFPIILCLPSLGTMKCSLEIHTSVETFLNHKLFWHLIRVQNCFIVFCHQKTKLFATPFCFIQSVNVYIENDISNLSL